MRLRSWLLLTLMAGPQMTWRLALAYSDAGPLLLAALAFGVLLLVPKSISLPILHLVRGVIAR